MSRASAAAATSPDTSEPAVEPEIHFSRGVGLVVFKGTAFGISFHFGQIYADRRTGDVTSEVRVYVGSNGAPANDLLFRTRLNNLTSSRSQAEMAKYLGERLQGPGWTGLAWFRRHTGRWSTRSDKAGELTHIAYAPAAIYNGDGTVRQQVLIGVDYHLLDQNSVDYPRDGHRAEARQEPVRRGRSSRARAQGAAGAVTFVKGGANASARDVYPGTGTWSSSA